MLAAGESRQREFALIVDRRATKDTEDVRDHQQKQRALSPDQTQKRRVHYWLQHAERVRRKRLHDRRLEEIRVGLRSNKSAEHSIGSKLSELEVNAQGQVSAAAIEESKRAAELERANTAYAGLSQEQGNPVSTLSESLERGMMRLRGIRHPQVVQEAMQYLLATMEPEIGKIHVEQEGKTPKVVQREVKYYRRQGYTEVEPEDIYIEKNRKPPVVLEKEYPIHLGRQEQQSLDQIAEVHNDPALAFHALQAIGYHLHSTSLKRNLEKNSKYSGNEAHGLDRLCAATQGVEDVLIQLGEELQWAPTYQHGDTNAALAETLEHYDIFAALRDNERRKQFVQFMQSHSSRRPQFTEMPLFFHAFSDPRYSESLRLLERARSKSMYDHYQYDLHYTVRALSAVEEAGGLPILHKLETAGVRIPHESRSQYLRILSQLESDELRTQYAREFVDDLQQNIGDKLDSSEATGFLAEYQSLTGESVSAEELKYVPAILPHKQLALAYATFVGSVLPNPSQHLRLEPLAERMKHPERITDLLNPGYAQFIRRLSGGGSMLVRASARDIIGEPGEDPSLFEQFQKDDVREIVLSDQFVDLAEYVRARGLGVTSMEPAALERLVPLLSIAGSIVFLNALQSYGIAFQHIDDLEQFAIRIKDKTQEEMQEQPAMLRNPDFKRFAERMGRMNQDLQRYVYTWDSLGQLEKTMQLFANDEVRERILDDAQWAMAEAVIQKLSEQGCTVVAGQERLTELTSNDMEHLAAYISAAGSRMNVNDFIAFSRNGAEVNEGLERYNELKPGERALTAYAALAELGADPRWKEHKEDMKFLFPGMVSSIESIQIALQDPQGLRALLEGTNTSLPGYCSPAQLRELMQLIPYRKTLDQLAKETADYTGYGNSNFVGIDVEKLKTVMAVPADERRVLYTRARTNDYLVSARYIDRLWSTLQYQEQHADIIALLTERWGDNWQMPDIEVALNELDEQNASELFDLLNEFNGETPPRLDWIPYLNRIRKSGAIPLLREGVADGEIFQPDQTNDIIALHVKNKESGGAHMRAYQALHEHYGIVFLQAIKNPDRLLQAAESDGVARAVAAVEAQGADTERYGSIFRNLPAYEVAGNHPEALQLLIRMNRYTNAGIAYIEHFIDVPNGPAIADFVDELAEKAGYFSFSSSGLARIVRMYEEQDVVNDLVQTYKYAPGDILQLNQDVFDENVRSYRAGGREVLATAANEFGYTPDYNNLRALFALAQSDRWEQFIDLHNRFGVDLKSAVESTDAMDQFFLVAPDTVILDRAQESLQRQQQLIAQMWNSMIEHKNFSPIRDLGIRIETVDGETLSGDEYAQRFVEKYAMGEKGRTLLVLLAAAEYDRTEDPRTVVERVLKRAALHERVLDEYQSQAIPDGLHASIGMEYEITGSTADGYMQQAEGRIFKEDIVRMSSIAGIPHGRDAVHEVATAPTDNPYAMLLEMQLLNELGFMDFNFTTPGYEKGSRGYHLSLGGETGVDRTKNSLFLQNALLMAGWGGINAGQELIGQLGRGRSDTVLARGSDSVQVFDRQGESVEFRALAIDKWEPFERTVLTSHAAVIAIQAAERCLVLVENVVAAADQLPESDHELVAAVSEQEYLQGVEPASAQEEAMIAAWVRLQAGIIRAVREHNEHFLENEMYGYEDNDGIWVNPDEFGGAENKARFESVVTGAYKSTDMKQFHETSLRVDPESLFTPASSELVNRLTRIANLFVKPSLESGGDQVNAQGVLSVTRLGNDRIEESPVGAVGKTVFERNGHRRQGYYSVQGGSERMVLHAVQRELLQFTARMEDIMRQATTPVRQAA